MKTKLLCIFFLIINIVISGSAFGEDITTPKCVAGDSCRLDDVAKVTGLSSKEIGKALDDPATLNKVLDTAIASDSKWKFLKDLNLKFKTFKANDDSSEALGISYNFSKDINKRLFAENNANQAGLSFSVNLEGNVSFNREVNPNDFLNSNLSLHFFNSLGGAVKVNDEVKTELNKLADELANIENRDDLFKSQVLKTFTDTMLKNMTSQFYADFSLVGGLESNQSFTEKQYYYGGQLGFDAKAWNPNSILAQYNIFDWPFAAIRWLSGTDDKFSPRGSTIPTVLFGIDLVDPQSGVIKQVHSDKSTFTRFRLEAAFRTPIVEVMKNNLAYFEADYRYYDEFNPSDETKKENLSNYGYFSSALILSNGIFISYSTGKLPMDVKNDEVYELGFKFNF
jgi:hypothetical protein